MSSVRRVAAALTVVVSLILATTVLPLIPRAAAGRSASDADPAPSSVPAADPIVRSSSGSGARNAVDGDPATRWLAAGGGPQWLVLDLRSVQLVIAVRQVFDSAQVWNFRIEGSLDGETWAGLVDRSYGAAGETFAESVSGHYRFVRLTVTGNDGRAKASSRELTVLVSPHGADLALGKPASASSALADYAAGKAVDADTSTYWVAGSGGGPHSLTVDLGAVSRVSRVEQHFKDIDVFDFVLDGSVDGNQWDRLGDNVARTAGQVFAYRADGNYRYVRLTVHSSPRGYWAASTSVKVFGAANLAPAAGVIAADGDREQLTGVLAGQSAAAWCVRDKSGPGAFVLELSDPAVLNEVRAGFSAGAQGSTRIETSADGRQWHPARVIQRGATTVAAPSTATVVRFLRMTTTAVRGCAAVLSRLQISGSGTMRPLSAGVVTEAGDSEGGHHPRRATDGDPATAWRAGTGASWLQVDLGNLSDVRRVEQTFESVQRWNFRLEASRDGKRWELLADQSGSTSGRHYSYGLRGIFRFVRLSAPAGAPKLNSVELTVSGNGSPVPAGWWRRTSGGMRYYAKFHRTRLDDITAQLDDLRRQGYQIIEPFAPYEGPAEDFAGLGGTNNYRIDPSIGTMADFHELIAAAHARGLKVVSFLNLGYTHVSAPFFVKAVEDFRAGVDSTERRWFALRRSTDVAGDCADPEQRWRRYRDPRTGRPTDVCFWAYWGDRIPSYDWNSAEWRTEARRITRFWMDQGLDGLGHDAPEVMLNITGERLRTAVVEVMDNYDAWAFPEGVQPVCCGFPLPVAEQAGFRHWVRNNGFNVIQDLSTTYWGAGGWGRVLAAARAGNPSTLDDAFKQGRDLVNHYGGATFTQPSWEVDLQGSGPVAAQDRLLEIATLTTAGQSFYLHAGYHEYRPETSVLPTWTATERERLDRLMRAQAGSAALDPVGLRVKLPTDDDNRYYAYVRRDRAGGVAALVVHNFGATSAEVTVDLTGSGLSLAQRPVDLLGAGKPQPVIDDASHAVSVPAKGSVVLAVH